MEGIHGRQSNMYTRSYGEDGVVDAAFIQELGEETRPVGLNVDIGGLHHRGDLVSLQFDSAKIIPRPLNWTGPSEITKLYQIRYDQEEC
jgi:hypothetical protein